MDDNLIERRRASFEECFARLIPDELEWCAVRKQYHGHYSWWLWTDKLQTWCDALDSAVVELPELSDLNHHGEFRRGLIRAADAIERAGLRVKS